MSRPADADRMTSALASLSSLGAAVAGVGVGVLFADRFAPFLWPIIIIGVVVHLYGMIGQQRLRTEQGYRPAAWETIGYWACWAALAALVLYVVVELAGGAA